MAAAVRGHWWLWLRRRGFGVEYARSGSNAVGWCCGKYVEGQRLETRLSYGMREVFRAIVGRFMSVPSHDRNGGA